MYIYTHTYEVCPESIPPCNMNIDTFIEDTKNTVKHLSSLQSRHPGTSHSSPITINCPIIFSWISPMVWNLFPFKGDFSFGKSQKLQPNLGCRGAESSGWFDVSPKNSARDVMHEQARCCNEAANHQLPIAAAFWTIQIISMEEYSSLTQNLVQVRCSTCSAILNVVVTQYTCWLGVGGASTAPTN